MESYPAHQYVNLSNRSLLRSAVRTLVNKSDKFFNVPCFVTLIFLACNRFPKFEVSNVAILLPEGWLQHESVFIYRFVVTENIGSTIRRYPKHSQFVLQGLHHLNSHIHCTEFYSKRACINWCLLLSVPVYWCFVDEYQYPSLASTILHITSMARVNKHVDWHRQPRGFRHIARHWVRHTTIEINPVIQFKKR